MRAVEPEALDGFGDGLDRAVRRAAQGEGGRVVRRGRFGGHGRLGVELGPDAVDQPPGALDPGGGPLHVALGRRVRQDEQAGGVDAIGVDDVGRRHDVLLRLRHLLDVADDHRLAGLDVRHARRLAPSLRISTSRGSTHSPFWRR